MKPLYEIVLKPGFKLWYDQKRKWAVVQERGNLESVIFKANLELVFIDGKGTSDITGNEFSRMGRFLNGCYMFKKCGYTVVVSSGDIESMKLIIKS